MTDDEVCILCSKKIEADDSTFIIAVDWVRLENSSRKFPVRANIVVHRECSRENDEKATKSALETYFSKNL